MNPNSRFWKNCCCCCSPLLTWALALAASATGVWVGLGMRRTSSRHVGHVCWRWNQERRQLVWKMWLHGSFLQDVVISSRQMMHTLSPDASSSAVAFGYLRTDNSNESKEEKKSQNREVISIHHFNLTAAGTSFPPLSPQKTWQGYKLGH